ncbi:hypothetical protein [Fluviispira multicolorata]|uniref:Uncharacterized protein n=1 Tax=Fluviispira multicolorata TaxID=2654512 RepID=A0A833N523_9BACT|nr:hypothetical protein [Fluviispira multicolorata]KAB8032063.1 hypothetical protein GCL57_05290 [Fluviispira multicolorata]
MKKKVSSVKCSSLKTKLAQEINKTRKEQNLTIAQIAKYLEVSTANAGKYANANVESPPYRVIACLARLQGRKVSDLVKEIEEEDNYKENDKFDDYMDVINFLNSDLENEFTLLFKMIRKKSSFHANIKLNIACLLRISRFLLMIDYDLLLKKEDEFHMFVKLYLMANKNIDSIDEQDLTESKSTIIMEHDKLFRISEAIKEKYLKKSQNASLK